VSVSARWWAALMPAQAPCLGARFTPLSLPPARPRYRETFPTRRRAR
jgi:hypothetical protein